MVVLNYTGGEINAKIVYYGPGVSGKTTNLEYIHEKAPAAAKGKMVSMKTQTDRTLFFDFLPLELGEINGYRTRFLLYTVPGQVYYNATRKLVLKGADAVVFVADSSRAKLDENLESLKNLEQNLNEHGMSLDDVPWVIQYNKRDLPDAMKVADLNARLNPLGVPAFEAVARTGTGVYETLHGIATRVYGVLKEKLEGEEGVEATAPAPAPPVAARPATRPAPARPAPARPPREMAAVAAGARPVNDTAAPAASAPEVRIEREHEVDHAVDFALRESEEDVRRSQRATAPPPPPRTPARPGVAREPVPSGGRTADSDDLFEAIPASGFDADLGRLPLLDEASAASDTARDAGPEEFVTDPMRHARREAAAPQPAKAARPAPVPSPKPAPSIPAPTAALKADPVPPALPRRPMSIPVVEELHVPVTVTREQLERASSLRIVLDLEIEHE